MKLGVVWPDSIRQVVPAEVDGSGTVLDGLGQGYRTGTSQVHTGLLRVAIEHWEGKRQDNGETGCRQGARKHKNTRITEIPAVCVWGCWHRPLSWWMLRSCRPAQAASSLSVPSTLVPTAWLMSSADRGRSAPNNRSKTPSSQEEKTTCVKGKMGDQKHTQPACTGPHYRPALQRIHLFITSPLVEVFHKKIRLCILVLYLTLKNNSILHLFILEYNIYSSPEHFF